MTSRDVSPRLAARNLADCVTGDPERLRDVPMLEPTSRLSPNDGDVVRMQFLPAERIPPTLPDGVVDVLLLSPQKEMRRVDTQRVVAPMTDVQAVRDRAVVQLPRKPVRLPPLRSRRGGMAETDLAVSRNNKTCPFPALSVLGMNRTVLIDAIPEPRYYRLLPAPRHPRQGHVTYRFAVNQTVIIGRCENPACFRVGRMARRHFTKPSARETIPTAHCRYLPTASPAGNLGIACRS
jgi:hypothetical protein